MRKAFLSGIVLVILLTGFSTRNPEPTCTCLYDETLKGLLQRQEIIASVKVIKIDTVRVIQSFLNPDKDALKYIYECKYLTLNVTYKMKKLLKGILATDTFSVLSLNECNYRFDDNQEYIVAANHREFCMPQLIYDSIECNKKSLLCTNMCCGNAEYSISTENYYIQNIK